MKGLFLKKAAIVCTDSKLLTLYEAITELNRDYVLLRTYASLVEFNADYRNIDIDLLLLDMSVTHNREIEIITEIFANKPQMDLLCLVDEYLPHQIIECFKYGISGVVKKSKYTLELRDALASIAKGEPYLNGQVAGYVINSIRKVSINNPLTPRENDVLRHLKYGATYSVIADKLCVSSETVKSHLKNIYRKLEVGNKAEAISRAMDMSLV